MSNDVDPGNAWKPLQTRQKVTEAEMAKCTRAPQIPCCQCGVIMHVYLQPGTDDDEAAYFVTCVNEVCVMQGHTLAANFYPPENLEIYLTLHENEDVLIVYIKLVRQESVHAAAALEQIYVAIGAQAALRAALIITIFRMEVKQNHWIPDMRVYAYLIQDYPEAVPLLEYAIGCCLQAWGIHDLGLIHLKINDPADWDGQARAAAPRP